MRLALYFYWTALVDTFISILQIMKLSLRGVNRLVQPDILSQWHGP